MIGARQCSELAGLSSHEAFLGVSPSARHEALFESYVSITHLTKKCLGELIVTDLRNFLDLGAVRQAADRFVVLRRLLSDYPEAQPVTPAWERAASTGARIRGGRPGLSRKGDSVSKKVGTAA